MTCSGGLSAPVGDGGTVFAMAFAMGGITTKAGVGISYARIGTSINRGRRVAGINAISCGGAISTPLSAGAGLGSLAMSGTAVSPTFSTTGADCATSMPFDILELGVDTVTRSNGSDIGVGDPGLATNNAAGTAIAMATRDNTGGACAVAMAHRDSPGCITDNRGELSTVAIGRCGLSPVFRSSIGGCLM